MYRLVAVIVFLLSASLSAFCQQTISWSDLVARRWVFAKAETATELVALAAPEEPGRSLDWAICARALTVTKIHPITNAEGARYEAAGSVNPGDHCLLVDSASHDAMFLWGAPEDPTVQKPVCIKGFVEQAEELTGRKLSSCYFLGGLGTGQIELVTYVATSPQDGMAVLLMDNQRTLPPDDPQRWAALLSPDGRGWSGGVFHPEQFHYLFTMARDDAKPNTDVQFVGIEWDGPTGSDLILYRPHGSTLKPVLVNHDAPAKDLSAEK